ncbi:hypothetical protein GmHk_14G041224 [Glycine max]|nr:hypothetical protein GmHk_14G041224 [Glycine max]
MNGNCLLISLNGHGDSEGDIFIMGTGIANLECAVRPPGNSNEAIPLEAIVQTIPPLERIPDDKVVQTNVLLVPPYP